MIRPKKDRPLLKILLTLSMVLAPYFGMALYTVLPCQAVQNPDEKEFFPSSKDTLVREGAAEDEPIPDELQNLAKPPQPAEGNDGAWLEFGKLIVGKIIGVLQALVEWMVDPLLKWTWSTITQSIYNPNIAADEPQELADKIKPVNNMLKDMAIDLLLLLFILSIWKYWTQGAWKGANLMAAVGRLIATMALIMAWSTISDYLISISNDMLAQMLFGPEDQKYLNQVIKTISADIAAGMLGGVVIGPLGTFIVFVILEILFVEVLYLFILKAIQNALIVAQYMFFPIFLVFFATPDTENIAAGFIKSCVEVSLWTFFWMGDVRILVYVDSLDIGNNGQYFWFKTFMLVGGLQLMLSVPQFIGRAQISPISEFFSGAIIFRSAFGAAKKYSNYMPWIGGGGLLGAGFRKLKDYYYGGGSDSTSLGGISDSGGASPQGATFNAGQGQRGSGPGGGGGGGGPTPPGGPGRSGPGGPGTGGAGGTPGAPGAGGAGQPLATGGVGAPGSGPPGTNRFAKNNAQGDQQEKSLLEPMGSLADQVNKGRVGENEGDKLAMHHAGDKGLTGLTYDKNMTDRQKAKAFAVAALAQELMQNKATREALGASLGWEPKDTGPGTLQASKERFNQALNEAALKGAHAYVNGQSGNKATELLKQMHGDLTQGKEAEMMESLTNSDLPHSVFNPNYKQNKEAVERAGLPVNAATMAMASSPEGSRLKGQALNAAFNALEQGMRPSLQAQGHTPGTPGYTQALAQAIAGSTPDKQKAVSAVGIGFKGAPQAEQPQTPEEWDAWATHTEALANSLGIRPDQAFGQLRGMMGTQAARSDNRPVAQKLETAAAALAAAREQKVPPQALTANAPLAGQLYELARDNNNALSPQRVYSALKAAQVAGFANPINPQDSALVDEMLTPDTGDWKAGEINPYTIGLARRAQAAGVGVNKDACMRVVAAGTPEANDRVAFAAAQRPEFDNMPPARAGNGVAAVTRECMDRARAHLGPTATQNQVDDLASHLASGDLTGVAPAHVPFATANSMTPQDILTYNDIAAQGRAAGIHYPLAEVRTASGLSAEGYGRIGDMATLVHSAVSTPTSSGGRVPLPIAAAGIRFMADQDFPRATRDNPDVVGTIGGMVSSHDSRLQNDDWLDAAKYAASGTVLPAYTPLHIGHLSSLASVAGMDVRQIGHDQYEQLERAFPAGSPVTAITSAGVKSIIGTSMVAPGAVHNATILNGHREFGALAGPSYQRAVNLAGGWAEQMHVQAPAVSSDQYLQSMPQEIRRVIVAAAEVGGSAVSGLSGAALTDYVSAVSTVARDLGLRDYGQAVQLVGGAATVGSSIDQTRLPHIIRAEQVLGTIGASKDARQNGDVLRMVTDLASVPTNATHLPELANMAVDAREIFSGADYNPANVSKLAGYLSTGGWGDRGMSRTEYEIADQIATSSGLAPARELVQRTVQFRAANPGVAVGTQHLLALMAMDPGRHDAQTINNSSELIREYAAAAARVDNPATTIPTEIRAMAHEVQSMQRETLSTLVAIQLQGGTAAVGPQLLNVVDAVNAVGGGQPGNSERVHFVLNNAVAMNAAGSHAGLEALARATQLYSVAELEEPANRHVIPTIQHMANHGWQANRIEQGNIASVHALQQLRPTTVSYTSHSGAGATPAPERVVVDRALMDRLEMARINPATESLLVHIAVRPELSSMRGAELRHACEGVGTYAAAAHAGGAIDTTNIDNMDSALIGAAVAMQRVKGIAACADEPAVTQIANDSSLRNNTAPPRGASMYTLGGARFFVT